jgi:hypothetical protein
MGEDQGLVQSGTFTAASAKPRSAAYTRAYAFASPHP